jgi:hypothetical protein
MEKMYNMPKAKKKAKKGKKVKKGGKVMATAIDEGVRRGMRY